MDTLNQLSVNEVHEKASNLALEGYRLRQSLEVWRAINSELLDAATYSTASVGAGSSDTVDHTGLLANAMFAAISIYLSGIYDYTITLWRSWDIPVPILTKEDVQCRVITILSSTRFALERTNISHLLYLFPLRVAGARCTNKWQCDQILSLLRRVGTNFVVAQAFETELRLLWDRIQV